MPKSEVPLSGLKHYLPDGSFDMVMEYLYTYHVELTVTRKRATILGDYRHKGKDANHRISVNGNLNHYSFLITLLHELAHMLTFEEYANRVQPHGKEWKTLFSRLLAKFIQQKIFPEPIETALKKSLQNPAASSCGDVHLLRVLKQYDEDAHETIHVEDVPEGSFFTIRGNRTFKKGEKIRTRFKCQEIANGKWFLFNGLYEVEKFEKEK